MATIKVAPSTTAIDVALNLSGSLAGFPATLYQLPAGTRIGFDTLPEVWEDTADIGQTWTPDLTGQTLDITLPTYNERAVAKAPFTTDLAGLESVVAFGEDALDKMQIPLTTAISFVMLPNGTYTTGRFFYVNSSAVTTATFNNAANDIFTTAWAKYVLTSTGVLLSIYGAFFTATNTIAIIGDAECYVTFRYRSSQDMTRAYAGAANLEFLNSFGYLPASPTELRTEYAIYSKKATTTTYSVSLIGETTTAGNPDAFLELAVDVKPASYLLRVTNENGDNLGEVTINETGVFDGFLPVRKADIDAATNLYANIIFGNVTHTVEISNNYDTLYTNGVQLNVTRNLF